MRRACQWLVNDSHHVPLIALASLAAIEFKVDARGGRGHHAQWRVERVQQRSQVFRVTRIKDKARQTLWRRLASLRVFVKDFGVLQGFATREDSRELV